MNAIGGYFELELRLGEHYHKGALRLNTARNCFEYILKARKYTKVYIPYYTCEVLLESLKRLNVNHEFYNIDNQLNPLFCKVLRENEAFLYTNYFGLKQATVLELSKTVKNLIVDNAQAFFARPIDGVDTFYSPRKFVGVPDGGFLYTDCCLDEELEQDISFNRMGYLLKRYECGAESAYLDFCEIESLLKNKPVCKMSKLTDGILRAIDYDRIINLRKSNYNLLASFLDESNQIHFKLNEDDVPMAYPYLAEMKDLKKHLISSKIFVATYWPNVFKWCPPDMIEYHLAEQLIPIPIDQRYRKEDMKEICFQIK